ncbi:MAG: N-glycosylase/DNA lyase [Bacteroidota bacterium]
MKTRSRKYVHIEELIAAHDERKGAIQQRLREFAAVPREDYFYELVYCLLTPQSSAQNATKAVEALRRADLFGSEIEPAALLHQKSFYIRFHNTKGRHLLLAKEQFWEIMSHLSNGASSQQLREWLVKNVKGLGWKEAAHFLRNVGHRDLAILDRHILRNLKRHGVIKALPTSLTTKKYHTIEKSFARFAEALNIPMDELDLLFWSNETGEILK